MTQQISGVDLITQERQRQVDAEGYTSDHDYLHNHSELALAGAAYALIGVSLPIGSSSFPIAPALWPFHRHEFKPSENRIQNLVRAGALIAAEIDRMQEVERLRHEVEAVQIHRAQMMDGSR